MESPAQSALPPIDVCLFGDSRRIPKIEGVSSSSASLSSLLDTQNGQVDDDNICDPNNNSDDSDSVKSSVINLSLDDDYDNLHLGHWGQAATQHDISMKELRKVATVGIPDEDSFRAIAWRVLLNYLPHKEINESWAIQVPPKREFYKQLVDQYFESSIEPGRALRGQQQHNKKSKSRKVKETTTTDPQQRHSEGSTNLDGSAVMADRALPANEIEDALPLKFREQWRNTGLTLDHMTSATSGDVFNLRLNCLRVPALTTDSPQDDFDDFLEDAKLLEEIRKDVARTLSHLLFFLDTSDNLGLRRYAALERILFLWAKLNKGVRYVQGMNEIAGTLYYVLANDENSSWADHAEEDTYFLFHTLMMDIRDVFVPDMDSHSTGIQGRIGNFQRLLQTHDPVVFEHLQECGIDSHFYAYRWLTTLLSREFLLPDTIRLWDSMFASTHKENFLKYVCVTMVMYVREELLQGDFSTNLRLLQRYPSTNVDAILDSARQLWMFQHQIIVACQKRGISWQEAILTVQRPRNLIMAFGYKGGVVPNFQDRLENATGQIMGQAQRLWSGWGKESAESVKEDGAALPVFDTQSLTSRPPTAATRSRLWNRVRGNTNDSDDNAALVSQEISEEHPAVQPATSDPTPRRRIWNQRPITRDPGHSATASDTQLQPLPTLRVATSATSITLLPNEHSSNTSALPHSASEDPGLLRRSWSQYKWKAEPTATS